MKFQIIGLNPNDQFSAHVLCRYTRAKDTLKYGKYVMISMAASPDDTITPILFPTFAAALSFIEAEKEAGSTWIYAVRPIFGA